MTNNEREPRSWTIAVAKNRAAMLDGPIEQVDVVEKSAYQNLLEENKRLKEIIRRDQEHGEAVWNANEKKKYKIAELETENKRLRAALEFYANEDMYKYPYDYSWAESDGGKTARRALSGEGEK